MSGMAILAASLIVVLAGLALVLTLGLWRSNGGLVAFLKGQFPPEPRHLNTEWAGLEESSRLSSYSVRILVKLEASLSQVSERYLSFSIDTSQAVGGKFWDPSASGFEIGSGSANATVFDFNNSRLDLLASALAPAYLRIGGSEADKVYYDLRCREMKATSIPDGYASSLTRAQWDSIGAFAQRNNLDLIFTLNAGPASRDHHRRWDGSNASELLAYTASQGYPLTLWELGNELNAFWFIHGLRNQISTSVYHHDLHDARALVKKYTPGALFTGQASAFWPVLGEPLNFFFGFMQDYLRRSGDLIDLVAWHYYPQQSRREPIGDRRAHPSRMLDPVNLDTAKYWAECINSWRDLYAPLKPVWLGETGNAQAGGEPGVSDAYIGGLWWLDQLGLLARQGTQVMVRQTLSGSQYGLLEDESLAPRPDYWNSLLWKRLMGRQVYATQLDGNSSGKLRVYAHASPPATGGIVTVLAINLDHTRQVQLLFPEFENRAYSLFECYTPDVIGKIVLLNGEKLALISGNALPELRGRREGGNGTPRISIRPLGYSFIVFSE
jgi:heparanase 1